MDKTKQKVLFNRVFSGILALAMVFGMAPFMAQADVPAEEKQEEAIVEVLPAPEEEPGLDAEEPLAEVPALEPADVSDDGSRNKSDDKSDDNPDDKPDVKPDDKPDVKPDDKPKPAPAGADEGIENTFTLDYLRGSHGTFTDYPSVKDDESTKTAADGKTHFTGIDPSTQVKGNLDYNGEKDGKGLPLGESGWRLAGWVADVDVTLSDGSTIEAGEPITQDDAAMIVVDKDIALTAQWEDATFTVTYVDGKDGKSFADEVYPDLSAGDAVPMPENVFPELEGFRFKGWTAAIDLVDADGFEYPAGTVMQPGEIGQLLLSDDIVFTGAWDTFHTLTYTDGLGGAAFKDSVDNEVCEGYTINRFEDDFKKAPKVFVGWVADVDLSDWEGSKTVAAGTVISNDELEELILPDSDVTLTAQWKDYTPVTVSLSDLHIKKVVTGSGAPSDSTFTFRLTALYSNVGITAANMPMPEGSSKGKQDSAPIGDGGEYAFGSITFTAPGTYAYAINELLPQTPGFQSDRSIVKIVFVVEGDGTSLTCTRTVTRGDKPIEPNSTIEFVNNYRWPAMALLGGQGGLGGRGFAVPATGDATLIALPAAMVALASGCLSVGLFVRRRGKDDKQ